MRRGQKANNQGELLGNPAVFLSPAALPTKLLPPP